MDTRSVFRGSMHGLQYKIFEIVHRWTFTPNKSETLVLLPKLLLKLCKHAKKAHVVLPQQPLLEVQALKQVHIVEWQPPKVYNLTDSIQISRKLSFITTTVN